MKEAPGFDRDKWLNLSDEARTEYAACVYEHYDYKCPYNENEIIGESEQTRDRSLEEPSGRTLQDLGGLEQKARPSRAWEVLRKVAELSNHLRENLKNKLIVEKSSLLLERLIYFTGKFHYF